MAISSPIPSEWLSSDWISNLRASVGNLSSAKSWASLFGYFCLCLCILFAMKLGGIVFRLITNHGLNIPELQLTSSSQVSPSSIKTPLGNYAIITSRNIFGIAPVTKTTQPPVKKTALQLRLVGTNTAADAKKFAIIENTKNREQDIFKIGENLFDTGAKISKISSESVELRHGGEIETLVIEEGASKGKGSGIDINEDATEFTVAEKELSDALANLPRLLSQARAVPFFRNGKSIGMRLFAIRRGSLYERLGLKNGDIVLSVNDNSLSDPSQALKLFEELKSERAIGVVVERNGGQQELRYAIR